MNVGVHTGLLDFKGMARIATGNPSPFPFQPRHIKQCSWTPGVLILRLGGAAEWTAQVDAGFKSWLTSYLPWVTGSKLALEEKATGK